MMLLEDLPLYVILGVCYAMVAIAAPFVLAYRGARWLWGDR
jgi:hypothetical protein